MEELEILERQETEDKELLTGRQGRLTEEERKEIKLIIEARRTSAAISLSTELKLTREVLLELPMEKRVKNHLEGTLARINELDELVETALTKLEAELARNLRPRFGSDRWRRMQDALMDLRETFIPFVNPARMITTAMQQHLERQQRLQTWIEESLKLEDDRTRETIRERR